MIRNPSSYRDPGGGVFSLEGKLFRYFTANGIAAFQAAEASGLLDYLQQRKALNGWRSVNLAQASSLAAIVHEAEAFLELEPVTFPSYCYEWSFAMLQDAALLTLELLRASLDKGCILQDATPYNVLFKGSRPVFIDLGSFQRYSEGQPWGSYSQFCRLFLNPLLLQRFTRTPFQPWLRGKLDGLEPSETARLLPFAAKLRRSVFLHVVVQAKLSKLNTPQQRILRNPYVAKRTINNMLNGLGRLVQSLKIHQASAWLRYENEHDYHPEAWSAKEGFVDRVVSRLRPRTAWDIGCNTGHFSLILAKYAEHVVAFDRDADAIDVLYRQAKGKVHNVLPLVLDLVDPSPSLGWAQSAQLGLIERSPADLVVMLAALHHICIGSNVPFTLLSEWLSRVAPTAILEFVPKDDLRSQDLLRWRPDVYDWYSQESFEHALTLRFTILEQLSLPHSGRVLYLVKKSNA